MATKKSKIISLAVVLMELEIIMLTEKRQTHKDKYIKVMGVNNCCSLDLKPFPQEGILV